MKALWDFRSCQVTKGQVDPLISHAGWKPGNQEVKGVCGFGEPRPYTVRQRKSSSPDASIPRHKGLHCWGHTCHVELNSSPVHLLEKAKAALTPRASCLLLFPFWSLSKGTFLVRWRLCNLWIVTQWQEFTIRFMSTAASHKVTGLVTLPAILSEKGSIKIWYWLGLNIAEFVSSGKDFKAVLLDFSHSVKEAENSTLTCYSWSVSK